MRYYIFLLSLLVSSVAKPQQPVQLSSSEIYQQIKKLDVLGNVLYLAAHPDDENTRFIAYCAKEKLFNTAYLSLTRGSGGQNLIGPEIRDALGIIRTQELLAARRIDGGQQFFSRANDFGYSKTTKETTEIWDREKVMYDIIWTIRYFRPDVIVLRFPPDERAGHGHHSASAVLGIEAFEKAADPKVFPDQLKEGVTPWQAKRIVTNTGRWWNPDVSANDEDIVAEDIGAYNALLGSSMNEIAAHSRSQHKSQGFGITPTRGTQMEYFRHQKGKQAKMDLFEDIDMSWKRVKGSNDVQELITQLINSYDITEPAQSIRTLIMLREELNMLKDDFWKQRKIKEVDYLIKACAGLYIEAKANDFTAAQGDSINVTFEFVNRSNTSVIVEHVSSFQLKTVNLVNQSLQNNNLIQPSFNYKIEELPFTHPYWLRKEGTLGMYNVNNPALIGKAESDPSVTFDVTVVIEGERLQYTIPLVYKENDPVKGEVYKPFIITPAATINFKEDIRLFAGQGSQEVEILVKAGQNNVNGIVSLQLPQGWKADNTEWPVTFTRKGEEKVIKVQLEPGNKPQNGTIKAVFKSGNNTFDRSMYTIAYDHIPMQMYFPKAKVQLVYVDLKKTNIRIGYIEGAGDVVPQSLAGIGYQVDILQEDALENLSQYHTIIMGVRALNTRPRVEFMLPALLDFVKNGGTLVMQYNTSHRLKAETFGPFPIKLSRDRVTEEDAEVKFLAPRHPVLNTPNKITEADFDGWVQERGLYFPNEWAPEYKPILRWHDEGESDKDGSLLIAEYGKGYYVYTGISFFRELPAAVPGAYRLLVNIISLGHGE